MELSGVVADFSFDAGLGEVAADDGRRFPFHCTAIADGTRDIAPGARVRFRVVAGHHGRWEAADVVTA